jgi:hypothetical protein
MRTYIGKVGGVKCYSDPLCPPDTAYLVPEGELLVPVGTPINKMIEDFVSKYKKHIGKFEFNSTAGSKKGSK